MSRRLAQPWHSIIHTVPREVGEPCGIVGGPGLQNKSRGVAISSLTIWENWSYINSCCREKPGSQLNAGGIPITIVVGRSILRNIYMQLISDMRRNSFEILSHKYCKCEKMWDASTHWQAISKYCNSLGSFCRSLSVMRFRKGFDRPELLSGKPKNFTGFTR